MKDNLLLLYQSSSFKTDLNKKTKISLAFFRQMALWEPNPQKSVQILLQILNPITNTEILAPESVGDQSEMVV